MIATVADSVLSGAPGSLVLEPEGLPASPAAPAPWTLTGSGYVFLVRLPESMTDAELFTPPALRGKRVGRVARLMLVDYATSAVGPYRELLVTPGFFRNQGRRFHSVTRIFVSTYESVVNGRRNWGIPKDVAEFSIDRRDARTEHIAVSRSGKVFAELDVQSYGFSIPIRSGLLPAVEHTLLQPWAGRTYETRLAARGLARPARVLGSRFDAELFPDLSRGNVTGGFFLPRFTMTFPMARVTVQ